MPKTNGYPGFLSLKNFMSGGSTTNAIVSVAVRRLYYEIMSEAAVYQEIEGYVSPRAGGYTPKDCKRLAAVARTLTGKQ